MTKIGAKAFMWSKFGVSLTLVFASRHRIHQIKSMGMKLLCVLLLFSVGGGKALSPPARQSAKRVAIVGAGGIAGLSVVHALSNSPKLQDKYGPCNFDISMFEAREKLDTKAGAGIQLSGGLAALGYMNPEVQRAVLDAGLPVSRIESRSKPWSSSKPFEDLLQLDLKETVTRAGGDVSESLMKDGELLWCAIMRGCLQESLWKTLPNRTRRKMQFNKSLINIEPQADGSVMCEFSDGSSAGPFDVVIGCDGVKSACKEYIETGKISADLSKREGTAAALYSGIRIKYAVDDAWLEKGQSSQPAVLKQFFGDGANCLAGKYGNGAGRPPSKIAFFVYLDKDYTGPFRKKEAAELSQVVSENIDWREGEKRNRELARKAITNGIQEYSIPSMDLDPIVKSADRFFELGIYFHNPFSFVGWSKKVAGKDSAVIALCGDAAHTIPPFLGQGSNQAIQDAYCLASKLYQYSADVDQGVEGPSLDKLLKDYERTRWLHTFVILLNTCFLGYLETGGENGFYSKFRDLFFKATGLVGIAQRVLLSAAVPKI